VTPDQKAQIKKVKNIFVATKTLQNLIDKMEDIRELSIIDNYKNAPDCMFITGETGVGKTTLIEQYMAVNDRYDEPFEGGERTIVPVLYCSLPKAKHPKPVVSELLYELSKSNYGMKGDVTDLTKTLIGQIKAANVELIIIDEFQHAIETTNKNVIQDIGEWFKIFLNKAKIPMVFVGVPWCYPILEVNQQLRRRVRKRHCKISNYTIETFKEFQQFIQAIENQLPVKPFEELCLSLNAFRLFAASDGNISELMDGVIIPACNKAIKDNSGVITKTHFIDAIEENTDFVRENNPFVLDIKNINAKQQVADSSWNPQAKKQEQRIIYPQYASVNFEDLNIANVLSKR
jgi:Cdc6-like AAA superfamily ATPase